MRVSVIVTVMGVSSARGWRVLGSVGNVCKGMGVGSCWGILVLVTAVGVMVRAGGVVTAHPINPSAKQTHVLLVNTIGFISWCTFISVSLLNFLNHAIQAIIRR
jgi:hypothetical protein